MKKTLLILLTVILLTVCAVTVTAAEDSGKCGDNLTWTLDGNTLTISGTGPMYNYSEENPAPWLQVGVRVFYVYIEEGVTSIGAYAFADLYSGSRIFVAASVERIGTKALSFSDSGTGAICFFGRIPVIAEDAFGGRKSTAGYLFEEEASVLQGYGGNITWDKGRISLTRSSKILYGLNEEIKPEDFILQTVFNSPAWSNYPERYTPREVTVGAYDNTAYGQKTVKVTVDGYHYDYLYYVTDGRNHLDLIEVNAPAYTYYNPIARIVEPVFTVGSLTFGRDGTFIVNYENTGKAGQYGRMVVKGKDAFEGYEETFPYAILKGDISQATITVKNAAFRGMPVMPEVEVRMGTGLLLGGYDYVLYCENNVNVGTATVRIVGKGNYCGSVTKTFQIVKEGTKADLKGAYSGVATGPINDNVYYAEGIVNPGVFTGKLDAGMNHIAYYELYRMDGDTTKLVTTKETGYGSGSQTQFVYDFSSVYQDAAKDGLAVYLLSYTWVDARYDVYSGVYVMYIPAKVSDATTMVAEQVEDTGDFRRAYVTAYGTDGNVGMAEWTSSDESVATVKDGVVTFKKPGSVTVTAQYGGMTGSVEVTAAPRDLKQCDVLAYDPQTGRAFVYYDGVLLAAGTDYALTVAEKEGMITVTATGRGLFSGQIVREFYADSGKNLDHTHSFDGCEDTTCGTCTFTRLAVHPYSEQWTKNSTHHWHACMACGKQADVEAHTLSAADETVCTVCGSLYTPGDLNGDGLVNEDDAIHLLQHILLPDYFTVTQDADYVRDNRVDEDDAIYLLQHVLLPEFFPLER